MFLLIFRPKYSASGEVKRLYFEAKGAFTLIKAEVPKTRLAAIPASDPDFLNEQPQADSEVCRTCGADHNMAKQNNQCSNCGDNKWVPAIN